MLHRALISFQFVITIVMISVLFSIARQNSYMRDYPIGFDREDILTFELSDITRTQRSAITELLRQEPSIREITFSNNTLASSRYNSRGLLSRDGQTWVSYEYLTVLPDFASFMKFDFIEGDPKAITDQTCGIIINESMAKQGGISVGENLGEITVVGIVRDFHYKPLQYPLQPFYLQLTSPENRYLDHGYVRSTNAQASIAHIKNVLDQFEPDKSRIDVRFFDESLGRLYEKEQNLARLISFFSVIAILISLVGVFGLVLFETQYRRREISTRKVFGASIREVLEMFNKTYIWIIGVSFVIAAPAAWFIVIRWLDSFAYRLAPAWWVFALALVLVLLITIVTVSLQSYRAGKVNPSEALKTE